MLHGFAPPCERRQRAAWTFRVAKRRGLSGRGISHFALAIGHWRLERLVAGSESLGPLASMSKCSMPNVKCSMKPKFPYSIRGKHVDFCFNDPATTEIYSLALHDALPISQPFR